jgi:hypothetical protein
MERCDCKPRCARLLGYSWRNAPQIGQVRLFFISSPVLIRIQVYENKLATAMSIVETLFDNHLLAMKTFNLEIENQLAGIIIESPLGAIALGGLEFNLSDD